MCKIQCVTFKTHCNWMELCNNRSTIIMYISWSLVAQPYPIIIIFNVVVSNSSLSWEEYKSMVSYSYGFSSVLNSSVLVGNGIWTQGLPNMNPLCHLNHKLIVMMSIWLRVLLLLKLKLFPWRYTGDVDARVHIYTATTLGRGRVASPTLGSIYAWESHSTHFTGGWVDPQD